MSYREGIFDAKENEVVTIKPDVRESQRINEWEDIILSYKNEMFNAKSNEVVTIEPNEMIDVIQLKYDKVNNVYQTDEGIKKILLFLLKFTLQKMANLLKTLLQVLIELMKLCWSMFVKFTKVLFDAFIFICGKVKDFVIYKCKTHEGKKTLAIIGLSLLLGGVSIFNITKDKKTQMEIEEYKQLVLSKDDQILKQEEVISKAKVLVEQVELLKQTQQTTRQVTKQTKKSQDVADRAVELFNLPAPNPKNFDAKYLPTLKHDILDVSVKKEALQWIEETYYKESKGNVAKLGDKVILNLKDITQISGLTAEQFDQILEGTQLKGIGKDLVKAEKDHKVNGIVLLSIAGLESGWGTSQKSKEINNITGFRVEDKNGDGTATKFKSKGDCIYKTAERLKQLYLTEKDNKFTKVKEGSFYNGKSLGSVNVMYCSQIDWFEKVSNIAHRKVEDLGKTLNL